MPMALPLIAAAGSIAAGVAAGATTLIGGAMIAGGALSAIGAITKNEKLTRIGGLVGLAGGVAGLATGAWSSAASTLAEQASSGAAMDMAAMDAMQGGFRGGIGAAADAATAGAAAGGPIPGGGAATQELANEAAKTAVAEAARPGNYTYAAAPRAGILDTVNNVGGWMQRNKELVNTVSGFAQGAGRNAAEQDMMEERLRQEEEAIARRRAQMSQSILGLRVPRYVKPAPAEPYAPAQYTPPAYSYTPTKP